MLPECLLNPPGGRRPSSLRPWSGGNVETSQRVVDVLLGALGLAAASQGTMNNLLFGDGAFGYYETICGGAGATPTAAGADAVHTHMTNTRLTDPEVLERRYPVRLREFSIRRGSAARATAGRGRGTAAWNFCGRSRSRSCRCAAALYAPYGQAGGQAGRLGAEYAAAARRGRELAARACCNCRFSPVMC